MEKQPLIFILKLRFPPGVSIATILKSVFLYSSLHSVHFS